MKKRTCKNGHQYYKSSDCPVCPECEKIRLAGGPFARLSNPAKRALENNGIKTVKQLSTFTKKEILSFHGMGPASIPILLKILEEEGHTFAS